MSSMLSSSAVVDLWKVGVSELSEAGPNASEHFWAVSKGYVAGFLTDAVSEDSGVRVVAALKSEYTQLLTVSNEEIWKAYPTGQLLPSLRWAANYWAIDKGYGSGALILERKTGHCLVAATDRRFVRQHGTTRDIASCHQYAVTDSDVVTAFIIKRTTSQEDGASDVLMLTYYGTAIDDDYEEEEQQPIASE